MEKRYRPDIKTHNPRGDLEQPRSTPPVANEIGVDGITPNLMRHDAIFQYGFDGGVIGISDVTTDVWVVKDYDAGAV